MDEAPNCTAIARGAEAHSGVLVALNKAAV
jgi:hypothetical protein